MGLDRIQTKAFWFSLTLVHFLPFGTTLYVTVLDNIIRIGSSLNETNAFDFFLPQWKFMNIINFISFLWLSIDRLIDKREIEIPYLQSAISAAPVLIFRVILIPVTEYEQRSMDYI